MSSHSRGGARDRAEASSRGDGHCRVAVERGRCPPEIAAVRSRLVDLLPIVRGHVGHPEFGGSFSLKQVAPVLAPSVDYDDLDGVSEGGEASRALIGLARGAVRSAEEEAVVRRALLEYCRRDTLALVELHRALAQLKPGPATVERRARR